MRVLRRKEGSKFERGCPSTRLLKERERGSVKYFQEERRGNDLVS